MSSLARETVQAQDRDLPLVVELESALLRVDLRAERFAGRLFRRPLDPETLPVRAEAADWLADERAQGRAIHLAASDETVGRAVAGRLGLFDSVRPSADVARDFPHGFVHVTAPPAAAATSGARAWLKALRPHQWSKNLLVLAPVALGLHQLTAGGLIRALAALVLLCAAASFTYLINDAADLAADRRHWSKKRRPLAAGAIPVGPALILAAAGIPLALALGWLLSPAVAAVLAAYVVTTLAYSFGLKAIPIADATVIGALFTLRLILGVAAASLLFSPWLLTFGAVFFCSLALAKRLTEILRADAAKGGRLPGRGYRVEDAALVLALGVSTSVASVLIIVLYLVEEVFPQGAYAHPAWLWASPVLLFLWVSRVWLFAHRGLMEDDPVVFALRDRVSLGLGAALAAAFGLALI